MYAGALFGPFAAGLPSLRNPCSGRPEPSYMTFEAQNCLGIKMLDCYLCRIFQPIPFILNCRYQTGISRQNARIHGFLIPINLFSCRRQLRRGGRGVGIFLDRSWPIRSAGVDFYAPLLIIKPSQPEQEKKRK